ncbi:MAG: GDP-mannose 4,6-dehydratase [Sulfurospirillum sp.]
MTKFIDRISFLKEGCEKASQKSIPYTIQKRRAGDIAACYANAAKAKEELGWEAKFGIDKMCEDSWNWQLKNPDGYGN